MHFVNEVTMKLSIADARDDLQDARLCSVHCVLTVVNRVLTVRNGRKAVEDCNAS